MQLSTIALAASIVGHVSATGCYPVYFLGRTYAIGEWASATVITVASISSVACSPPGVDDCPASGLKTEGGFISSNVYNFQCISDNNMCSNDEHAPGSIKSTQAWKRESTPCLVKQEEHDDLLAKESTAGAVGSVSIVTESISRKLQTTTSPTTSQPTGPTNAPTASPTNLPTTSKPTSSPSTQPPTPNTTAKPTSNPTLKPTSLTVGPTNTFQPTPNPTTAQPAVGRLTASPTNTPLPTPNPASPTTSIPTPNPAAGASTMPPTSIPTSAKPFTIPPTWKKPWPRPPPGQCLCPCPGSKSSKNGKNGKTTSTSKAGKTRTKAGKTSCPCPCAPVKVPTCYRCRPHTDRTNRAPQTKLIA